jgi:hypothetical protein
MATLPRSGATARPLFDRRIARTRRIAPNGAQEIQHGSQANLCLMGALAFSLERFNQLSLVSDIE